MEIAKCDERGRVTLGKELIGRYGRRFVVVPAPREIVLLPIPKDPIKDLQELGRQGTPLLFLCDKLSADSVCFTNIDGRRVVFCSQAGAESCGNSWQPSFSNRPLAIVLERT